MQGSAALSFVRQRHGLPGGDLDRVRRQQAFLAGAANKILSVGTLSNPAKLSSLVTAANRSLVLDKNFDLLSFGQQMVGLTSGHITFVTIPTAGSETSSGTDALATDPAKIRAFFAGLTSGGGAAATSSGSPSTAATTVNRASWTVDVQNATMTQGMAAAVGQKAADAGFQRGQLSDYPDVTQDNQQASTSVHYPRRRGLRCSRTAEDPGPRIAGRGRRSHPRPSAGDCRSGSAEAIRAARPLRRCTAADGRRLGFGSVRPARRPRRPAHPRLPQRPGCPALRTARSTPLTPAASTDPRWRPIPKARRGGHSWRHSRSVIRGCLDWWSTPRTAGPSCHRPRSRIGPRRCAACCATNWVRTPATS